MKEIPAISKGMGSSPHFSVRTLLRVLMQGAWEMVEFVKDSLCKQVPSYIPQSTSSVLMAAGEWSQVHPLARWRASLASRGGPDTDVESH